MNRSNDERLLDLRTLVRQRFERDLQSLRDISASKPELSLNDLLDELHNIYVHYLQLDTLLNNASTNINREGTSFQDQINKLRSIDS